LLTQPCFQSLYETGALFFANPQTLFGALAVDAAFDIEQDIDALDRFERDRRDRRRLEADPLWQVYRRIVLEEGTPVDMENQILKPVPFFVPR
jgi:hypothetical protein